MREDRQSIMTTPTAIRACWCALLLFALLRPVPEAMGQTVDLRKEYAATLRELSQALLERVIGDPRDRDYGAIRCAHCNVLHTRAAEAVYPFAVVYKISGDGAYRDAAIRMGNWLIRQQEKDGGWKETPEEWTGTTTDQLLMMVLAYEHLSGELSAGERQEWRTAIEKAADYLTAVMSPEFASINYVATTTASLTAAQRLIPKAAYLQKARELARRTVSKMDEDGFLNGEGGRDHKNKTGVDLGYDMEMSLWGLGYYAKNTGDSIVYRAVAHALTNHLFFLYPDGSLDGSWGIRSNKWTTYGGVTSDGCQVLFSLFADEDPRYATASLKNLEFLRTNMHGGIIGYGPQHWEIFNTPPCIYPTFTKAKNLALAFDLEHRPSRRLSPLPTQITGWMKEFKTVDVVQVRTGQIMATLTAYGYEDHAARTKSKYMYRPSGGTISNLWVQDHGFLQASSVTEYSRPEPMTFPEAPGIRTLSSRIEFSDTLGYFTNLFEFDARLEVDGTVNGSAPYRVKATGELKDRNWLLGGVRYNIDYEFADSSIRKTIRLTYHDARPTISIVEPIIDYKGMVFTQVDARTIRILAGRRVFEFKVESGPGELRLGYERDKYWTPFPALKACPIAFLVPPPVEGFSREVSYTMAILPAR
jgi:hypothetical protein